MAALCKAVLLGSIASAVVLTGGKLPATAHPLFSSIEGVFLTTPSVVLAKHGKHGKHGGRGKKWAYYGRGWAYAPAIPYVMSPLYVAPGSGAQAPSWSKAP